MSTVDEFFDRFALDDEAGSVTIAARMQEGDYVGYHGEIEAVFFGCVLFFATIDAVWNTHPIWIPRSETLLTLGIAAEEQGTEGFIFVKREFADRVMW